MADCVMLRQLVAAKWIVTFTSFFIGLSVFHVMQTKTNRLAHGVSTCLNSMLSERCIAIWLLVMICNDLNRILLLNGLFALGVRLDLGQLSSDTNRRLNRWIQEPRVTKFNQRRTDDTKRLPRPLKPAPGKLTLQNRQEALNVLLTCILDVVRSWNSVTTGYPAVFSTSQPPPISFH